MLFFSQQQATKVAEEATGTQVCGVREQQQQQRGCEDALILDAESWDAESWMQLLAFHQREFGD